MNKKEQQRMNIEAVRKKKQEAEKLKKQKTTKTIIIIAVVAVVCIALLIGIIILATHEETYPNKVKMNVTYEDNDGNKHTGDIIIQLNPDEAPITVKNFQKLVSEGFYDGITFHRVIEGFMIQGGDPDGNGRGGSKNTIKGEFKINGVNNNIKHVRGTISMARQSNNYNSAASQFFIVHQTSADNTASLDGQYAAFGNVISGMEIVDGIAAMETDAYDKPLKDAIINSITFIEE